MKICLFVVEEKINPPLIWRFLDHLTCKIPFKIIRFRTTNIYLNTIDSVFVETNLNLASTISGERLCSEEEIADYIAGMMVLEVEPYFYIECAGVYQGNSVEFYEFRCYR